jgi:hypothetical protein
MLGLQRQFVFAPASCQRLPELALLIGVVNTVRSLNQFTTGYGDYTVERDTLFADVTLDDIVTDIKLERLQKNESQDEVDG